jgi:hypothetical protein
MVLTGAAAMDATESRSESDLECGDSLPLSDSGRDSVVAGLRAVRRGGSFECGSRNLSNTESRRKQRFDDREQEGK